jgi:hypothetical protein
MPYFESIEKVCANKSDSHLPTYLWILATERCLFHPKILLVFRYLTQNHIPNS